MDAISTIKEIDTNLTLSISSIDEIKAKYESLRRARNSYLDIKRKKHVPFSPLYRRKVLHSKNNYEKTFNKVFEKFFYYTKKVKYALTHLLSFDISTNNELVDCYNKLSSLQVKIGALPEDINIDYLTKVGIEEFDQNMMYARNLFYDLNGKIHDFLRIYSGDESRMKDPSIERKGISPTNKTITFNGE